MKLSTALINANSLHIPLANESVQMVATSPPYFGLRDYGTSAQIGLEKTVNEYVDNLVCVFREVWRVLRPDGIAWLNLGDSYFSDTEGTGGPSQKQLSNSGSRYEARKFSRTGGLKPKDLIGVPWRVAFALQDDGWYLRSDCIWSKPNPMPESVKDRPTKAHEYIFLLSKQARYFYNASAIKEPHQSEEGPGRNRSNENYNESYPGGRFSEGIRTFYGDEGRNKRSVWEVSTSAYEGAHFATWPPALVEPMIKAGSRAGDIVLDPFAGSGTTGVVSRKLGRNFIGLDLSFSYLTQCARPRLSLDALEEWTDGVPTPGKATSTNGYHDLPLFEAQP